MRLVLLGPPGVGKGTQADLLSQRFGIPKVATGDLLREVANSGTELGRRIRGYLKAGELVPDEIMMELVQERLSQQDCERGFILDGFPRNVFQAQRLDEILASSHTKLDLVVELNADVEEIIQRLTNRRVCRRCGANYNLISNPPPSDNICKLCGGEIYQREDDEEEVIRRRLEVYQEQTKPVREFYSQTGRLRTVSGTGAPEEVFENLLRVLRR